MDPVQRQTAETVLLKKLYPEGRTLFYEGMTNPEALEEFLADMDNRGLEVSISVHVPADHLYEVTKTWKMGS